MNRRMMPLLLAALLAVLLPLAFRADAQTPTIHPTVLSPLKDGVSLAPPPGLEDSPLAAKGFVDVTHPLFGADATGTRDSTQALRGAIRFARNHQLVCWFPSGTYLVSDTISCDQSYYRRSNGTISSAREYPNVLMGEAAPGSPRPVIRLVDSAPGFQSPAKRKYVIHIWTQSAFRQNKPANTPEPNINFNQMFKGIDIVIGKGNPGAVGIRLRGAQGTSVQDCRIDATYGHTGLEGASGSGGSHQNVTVIGGRIGLDLADTQPAATITAMTLIDQTEHAIVYSGRQALAAVGVRIRKQEGVAIAGPANAMRAHNGQICLEDAEIIFTDKPGVVIESGESLYLKNVYARNAATLVQSGRYPLVPGEPDGWTHLAEYGRAVDPRPAKGYRYRAAMLMDGRRVAQLQEGPTARQLPPQDLFARHLPGTVPAWSHPDAADAVRDYGARGDGVADDTAALQRAVNENEIVFLPKGYYRITKTLRLKPDTKLIGVARHLSIIMASARGDFADPSAAAPMVETADTAQAQTVLAYLDLFAPAEVGGAYPLRFLSGGSSVIRDINLTFRSLDGFSPKKDPVAKDHAEVIFEGNAGARVYNLFHESPVRHLKGYRHFLVRGTRNPLRFYQLNPEHARPEANFGLEDAHNVVVWGLKSEGNNPVLVAKDSSDFRILGYGGNGSALPGQALFLLENCEDFMLAMLMDEPRPSGGSIDFFAGMGVPPDRWYMLRETRPGGEVERTDLLLRPVVYRRGTPKTPPGPVILPFEGTARPR